MTIAAAVITAVIVLSMSYMFFFSEEKGPSVTAIGPDGTSLGSVSVTRNGFVSIDWMEIQEAKITADGKPLGISFAGWYTDSSFETPFYRYTQITGNINIYADSNELDFSLTQSSVISDVNKRSCTFTPEGFTPDPGSVTWTITDSFKTWGTVPGAVTDSPAATHALNMGMYDVTMTAAVDGEEKKTTKAVIVGEPAENPGDLGDEIKTTVTWTDYEGNARTLSYSFSVADYIGFAKMNRMRDFRIPAIAGFVVWDWVTSNPNPVKEIADKLVKMADDEGMTEQQKMNLIASYVNSGEWVSDSKYYRIPGVHKNDVSVEYYKYPMEALYDWILYGGPGDCECKSILTAAIARAAGFEYVGIIVLTNPSPTVLEGHAVAGIKHADFEPPVPRSGTYFYQLNDYYACDTVSPGPALAGLRLGELLEKYNGDGWSKRLFTVS